MKPYYESGGITIYHGDCRDVLPTLGAVDLVLTDPPYGIRMNPDKGRFSGGKPENQSKRRTSTPVNRDRVHGDGESFDPSFLLRHGTGQIIWGWNNFPDRLPRGACLVWLKRNDKAFGTFLSDAETAWMSKGHGVYCKRVLVQSIASTRTHPTEKPLELMRWCLDFYPDSQTVLDPFMGSGTTLRAAKDLGKRAIGIELNEAYCETAARRLAQEVLL